MKKIASFVNNSNFLDRIKAFCAQEDFEYLDLGRDEFKYDVSIVMCIHDTPLPFDPSLLRDIPLCFIGKQEDAGISRYILREDFTIVHLRLLVDELYHGTAVENCVPSLTPIMLDKVYSAGNDLFSVEKVVYAITGDLVHFFHFQELEKIRIGIAEMLTNAIEHGNLGITGKEKLESTEKGEYYELVARKLANRDFAARKVTIGMKSEGSSIVISITDEGKGFDAAKLPDPTHSEQLLKLHGRGILITRMYFDEVKYNTTGNQVTLVKRLR